MIKPEQIPPDVLEAAAMALCKEQCMFWPGLNNDERNIIRGEARAAIAAALSAWVGMRAMGADDSVIYLPLTEARDE